MAQAYQLTCHQAQQLMQGLLDRRWTKPIPPPLQSHFQTCTPCAAWLTLFDYEPIPLESGPSSGFSERVIDALQRENLGNQQMPVRRLRRLKTARYFASAAAVILLSALGLYLLLPGQGVN